MMSIIILILEALSSIPGIIELIKDIIDLFRKAPHDAQLKAKEDIMFAMRGYKASKDVNLLAVRLHNVLDRLQLRA